MHRQLELTGVEQLDALETETSGVHRVLGVVAVLGEEFVALTAVAATVASAAGSEEALG